MCPDHLHDVVRAATGLADVVVGEWSCRPLGHRIENLTTRSLDRYEGTVAGGPAWSVVSKVVQPASKHPVFETIPVEMRPVVLGAVNWRDEPAFYRCGLGEQLPSPMRMPRIHAIVEDGDTIVMWLEDIADVVPWTVERYRRTARALGRLGGRWPSERAIERFGVGRRDVGSMFFSKITHVDLPIQADDAFWRQAEVADQVDADHRHDLFRLAERMPALIASLDRQPIGLCHGDATPDNFLEPGDGSIVAIDWAFGNVDALASDLGQLLVGRFESGAATVDDLPGIVGTILDSYAEGLADEGLDVAPDVLERAWAIHLAIRSVFSALVVDHRDDLDAEGRADLLRRRAAYARFGLDLALRQPLP